ncbi:MAG: indolepyruvate ferredoxin oxidoreductase subunit alpha, partial [Thermodesulfobacteriota bacterium]
KRPFYFEFSTNEKVAVEIAYGAALNGYFSTVFFKSVGLNVAADMVVQLSLMNIIGGLVVVLGDDPGANSSQNEQDNRHYAMMAYTPVLEPASPSEVYSFYKEAARIAKKHQMPVILRMTTHVCHAKERVSFDSWDGKPFTALPKFSAANGPYIPLTSEVFPMKRRAMARLDAVEAETDGSGLNPVVDHQNRERGIITFGLPFLSVMDVIREATVKPDILKIGSVYPVPKNEIRRFLESHSQIRVVEELDDILEKEVKAIAYDSGLSVKIIGKTEREEWVGEYTPDKVRTVLRNTWPDLFPISPEQIPLIMEAPKRPPQLCPGCGHRSAFFAIKKALKENDITVADIGCHTLGYLPPYRVGELLMCMGASPGIGSGLSLFNTTRKVIVFLGDSTFFHAGLPGIINAIFNRHNITLILMENGTTAMTGHQDHPGVGKNFNQPTDKIPVRQLLEGIGVKHIFEVDTYQQSRLTELVKQAAATDGFSVVIARHPCMLKFNREQRKKSNYRLRQVEIDQDKCRRIHDCVAAFGCPTFTRHEDGSVTVNPDLCIGDGSCIQTCPAQAISMRTDQG